ncbi:MAG: (d)CMP kinase [Methylococcales bacterium]|jgi:CMP/dCMP kinase|nr:(d)CMP kinase [Methylococcales bacterium]MBT7410606.1 (d)CMP kinase [Methylococcales bacterium]
MLCITVDGPSGSGKGTISLLLANRLSLNYLDSGAIYRLMAYAASNKGIDLTDENSVADYANEIDVKFKISDDAMSCQVILNSAIVTDEIRTEQAGNNASKIAVFPKVRAALLELQRNFLISPGLVADGRDMGTVVFADAPYKFFLTASAEERAMRRYKQLTDKGYSVELEALTKEIEARDERDSSRSASPLKPADDAILIDSTSLPIDGVLEKIMAVIQ